MKKKKKHQWGVSFQCKDDVRSYWAFSTVTTDKKRINAIDLAAKLAERDGVHSLTIVAISYLGRW